MLSHRCIYVHHVSRSVAVVAHVLHGEGGDSLVGRIFGNASHYLKESVANERPITEKRAKLTDNTMCMNTWNATNAAKM